MVTSKAFLSFLLINLFSNFHLCFSDGLDSLLSGIVMKDAQCMQKLLPCQPYLKNPTNPSPACCSPLNEIAINSSDCLCNLMNNPKLFLSLDVSKDEILKLPNACGINVDTSKCNAEGTVPTPSEVDETLSEEESTEEFSSSSRKMVTPYGIISFVALLTALVFSAY